MELQGNYAFLAYMMVIEIKVHILTNDLNKIDLKYLIKVEEVRFLNI